MVDTQSNLEEAYRQIELLKDQNALLKAHTGGEKGEVITKIHLTLEKCEMCM